MAAIRLRARAELRARWRGWLALAVLIGLLGGLVTALAGGARRAETAYERLQRRSAPADLLVLDTTLLLPDAAASVDLDEASHLPGVVNAVVVRALLVVGGTADGREIPPAAVAPFSAPSRDLGQTVERKHLLDGRLPDPDAPDEILVSYEAARRYDLSPGSTLELDLVRTDQVIPALTPFLVDLADRVSGRDTSAADVAAAGGARRHLFAVTGVATSPMDFPPVPGTLQPIVYPTPAFHQATGRHQAGTPILLVRLDSGVPISAYKADLERHNPGHNIAYSGGTEDRAATVQHSIGLQAKGVWFLAALVGLASAMIAAQLISRKVALESDDVPSLHALGMTTGQMFAIGAMRAAAVAAVAGAVVVVMGIALSPLFPLGTAAAAEPSPGVRADSLALGTGAVVVALLTFVVSALTARLRIASVLRAKDAGRSAAGARRARRFRHVPITLTLGSQLALDSGGGRTAVPVRSTLGSLSVAVGAAALALTVVASLGHLTETPRLYGWVWDVQIGGVGTPDISEPLAAGLRENDAVADVAVGGIPQLEINGVRVDAYAVDDVQGTIAVALLEGRAPTRSDEIVLGTVTLDDVGAVVGDHVNVSTGDRIVSMQVVGRGVFPSLGDAGQLGRGARITFAGLEQMAPGSLRTMALVDFVDDASVPAEVADLRRALDIYPVHEDLRPQDLLNFGRGGSLTRAIGLVLASKDRHGCSSSSPEACSASSRRCS